MTVTLSKTPTAILTEHDILEDAAQELARHERMRLALRGSDIRLRTLCRQYEAATGYRGLAPHHLTQMCRARGLL